MMTQTMGKTFYASLLASARQGLFFIPAILILPEFFGVTGLQLAQPIADGFTFILTQVIVVMVVKELRGMAKQEEAAC